MAELQRGVIWSSFLYLKSNEMRLLIAFAIYKHVRVHSIDLITLLHCIIYVKYHFIRRWNGSILNVIVVCCGDFSQIIYVLNRTNWSESYAYFQYNISYLDFNIWNINRAGNSIHFRHRCSRESVKIFETEIISTWVGLELPTFGFMSNALTIWAIRARHLLFVNIHASF